MDDEPDDETTPDDSGKVRSIVDSYADVELPILPIGSNGLPALGLIGPPTPIPPASPDTFVCLRGPCRYYWERQTFMASGNPAETWGPDGLKDEDGNPIRAPRQIDRTCTAHPGTETELTEDTVYACTRWDPLTQREIRARDKRIRKYLRLYPQHAKEN